VLSRLISLLSRISAVKWAFNRLRPPPHSGSLDVAPIDISVGKDSSLETPAEAEPVVVEELLPSQVEDESEPVDATELISSDPPEELLKTVEPEIVEEAPVSSIEAGAVDAREPVISCDAPPELLADVEPVVAEQVFITPAETATVPVAPSELVAEDEPTVSVESEPVVAVETPAVLVDTETSALVVIEASIDSEPAPGVAAEIEPDTAPVSPAPMNSSAPKALAKGVEPADRTALIRQRWAETGIRMWNPRLHGTGDATLNIQGRIGLLPPEPGETMPRYDKLEFKMLGGQIVCEGVIVEAPVHAGQRSFTRLAEPRGADHTREPVLERQAAIA
jgi:hypothetical protein